MSPGNWNRHLLLPLLKHEITTKKTERRKKEREKSNFIVFVCMVIQSRLLHPVRLRKDLAFFNELCEKFLNDLI